MPKNVNINPKIIRRKHKFIIPVVFEATWEELIIVVATTLYSGYYEQVGFKSRQDILDCFQWFLQSGYSFDEMRLQLDSNLDEDMEEYEEVSILTVAESILVRLGLKV